MFANLCMGGHLLSNAYMIAPPIRTLYLSKEAPMGVGSYIVIIYDHIAFRMHKTLDFHPIQKIQYILRKIIL